MHSSLHVRLHEANIQFREAELCPIKPAYSTIIMEMIDKVYTTKIALLYITNFKLADTLKIKINILVVVIAWTAYRDAKFHLSHVKVNGSTITTTVNMLLV